MSGNFTFPIVRKVSPNLIANDLVSVQPMSGSVGGSFSVGPIFEEGDMVTFTETAMKKILGDWEWPGKPLFGKILKIWVTDVQVECFLDDGGSRTAEFKYYTDLEKM